MSNEQRLREIEEIKSGTKRTTKTIKDIEKEISNFGLGLISFIKSPVFLIVLILITLLIVGITVLI